MPGSTEVVSLLAAFSAVASRLGLRWYLFGAQAALAYGAPRTTADVDVTVELPSDDPHDLVAALEGAGFRLRVRDVEDFVLRTRVLPFLHEGSAIGLDVVLAGPGLEEEFFAASRTIDFGDLPVPTISPEDLVVTKILSGRSKDLEDVRSVLLEQRGSLDAQRVRWLLGVLESALARNDLMSEFERIEGSVR